MEGTDAGGNPLIDGGVEIIGVSLNDCFCHNVRTPCS